MSSPLTRGFVARLGEARARALLDAAYAQGAAAFPAFELDREAFASELVRRLSDEDDPEAALARTHVDDLFVAVACAHGDPRALAHFERTFMSAIPAAIARVAKDTSVREEVAQRLRLKLFVATDERAAKIADYNGRGPLAGWLRVAAVREALNLQRGARADVDLDDVAQQAPARDPELALVRARHGRDLADAFREAVAALPDDDRTMLRMHYVDGHELEDIGRVFGVHRTTASRWLAKTREKVLEGTRRRVRDLLHGSPSEVESVLRLAQSDLDISLNRVLGTPRSK
ncbi:MAG: sigma-70 family RNA polymerase sigma factor [Deltaproteobacteria bacterium]|nr:sigma-70 family RNA polymerase sigma factor [Deltaproteobacteria bacterium]